MKLLRTPAWHLVARPIRKALSLQIRFLTALLLRARAVEHAFIARLVRLFPDFLAFAPRSEAALLEHYLVTLKVRAQSYPYQPKISVIVPVYKVDPTVFRDTLTSVTTQVYGNWELCIVDDASNDPRLTEIIEGVAKHHPGKVQFAVNDRNSHISETSNRCLTLATGDYVALLDHDDLLMPHALAEMVRFINLRRRPEILYSDERIVDAEGHLRHGPFHKPGWSPFLHLSSNYTTHLTVYRTDLVRRAGGFRKGYEGSQDHDLMLRAVEAASTPVVHVPFVLYQWRAVEGSTAQSIDGKPYAVTNGIRAVTEACARRGRPAEVTWEPASLHYRVKFALPDAKPLVSVIIPTKDHPKLLASCLASLFDKSSYPRFEVLMVDNGTKDPEAKRILADYANKYPDRFRVLPYDAPFNFGAMNNLATTAARGSFLLFLNNDTEVRTADWIEELLRLAQFPEVGAVGCQLIYQEECLQHIGILLVDRNIACHALRTYPVGDHTYVSMANTTHDVAAVTAACMLIETAKFRAAGGFDELNLPNGFGDVDLCLKLRKSGHTNVYTPYAVLTHKESKTRGRAIESFERQVMIERWGGELMNDPFLNFNLGRNEHYQPGESPLVDFSRASLRAYWQQSETQV